MRKPGCLKIVLGVFCVALVSLTIGQQVLAKTADTTLLNKALANGLKKCYSSAYIISGNGDGEKITTGNTYNASQLLTKAGKSDKIVNIPSKIGSTLSVGNDTISCSSLFSGFEFGTQHMKGLLGGSSSGSIPQKLGYTMTDDGSSVCVSYSFDYRSSSGSGTSVGQTNQICFNVSDGVVNIGNTMIGTPASSGDKSVDLHLVDVGGSINAIDYNDSGAMSGMDSGKYIFGLKGGMSVEDLENAARGGLGNMASIKANGANITPALQFDAASDVAKKWVINDWGLAALTALNNLTPYTDWSQAAFTEQEKYDLYVGYLLGKNSVYELYALSSTCTSDATASSTSIPFKENGNITWCDLGGDLSSNKNVNIFAGSNNEFLDSEVGPMGVIAALRGLNLNDVGLTSINTSTGEVGSTISTPAGETDECYAGSGALGWLICPVVKMLSGIGDHMWNQIETYHLKLPANDLFENGGGVQQAWGTVRDIANVAFVILFLVVIFSQITGVGIDNYGIKRILPKLIITAILINLSFIICAVAVDLSNIFGMGINSLLTEQADKIAVAQGMSGGAQAASWGMTALLGGGGVALFVVLNPAGALAAAAAIGLAVLGLIITVVTSMFFMYITLVVRQAGVILMIVLAPVALACYMLPNTEKLFKKWFDLFKALLIVYPICGALIGAGQLAGAVLASIDSENMKVAAMLVQVVPFFLLPMIIRNSLSLMGNIGGRLSTWGRNLGRRGSNFAQGQIRNSERFKDWQKFQQDRTTENRARRTIRSLSGRTLDRRGQERLAKARAIVLEQEKARRENALNAREDTFNARLAKQNLETDEARLDLDKYSNADYIEGKRVQGRLSRENDVGASVLYNTPGFEESKRRQYAANRSGEIKKMYSEQYSNLDKAAKQGHLQAALAGHGANDAERADAAFSALMATGDKAEILDAINGADFSTMDANVRERIVALAAASGDQLLKGWAKAGGTMNLDTYINSGRFKNYLSNQAGDNAFNNADKDTLKFLAAHNGAQAMSDTMIKNISVTAANNNQDSANAASALINSVPGRKAAIGSLVTGDDLTRMSSTIEQAYRINASDARTTTLGSAVADINKPGNEALRSKVNRRVGGDLGIS